MLADQIPPSDSHNMHPSVLNPVDYLTPHFCVTFLFGGAENRESLVTFTSGKTKTWLRLRILLIRMHIHFFAPYDIFYRIRRPDLLGKSTNQTWPTATCLDPQIAPSQKDTSTMPYFQPHLVRTCLNTFFSVTFFFTRGRKGKAIQPPLVWLPTNLAPCCWDIRANLRAV